MSVRSCLSALVLCLGAGPLQAAVICVPNMAVDGSCTSSAVTISAGIAAANIGGGDTVLVGNGLYLEAPVIDRPLILQAKNPASVANAGNPAMQAIINGNGAIYTLSVNSNVTDVVINWFEVTNPTHAGINTDASGIRVGTDSAGASTVNVVISGNIIHAVSDSSRTSASFGELGISAFNLGPNSVISQNTIYDISDSAPPTSGGESPGSGRAQGILVKSSNGTASGAVISDNIIRDVRDVGIRFNGVALTNACRVTSNSIRNIGSPGTGFLSGIGIDFIGTGNSSFNDGIAYNFIHNISGGFGLGIQVTGDPNVFQNVVSDVFGGNGMTFPGAAVLANTSGVTVDGNLLANSAIGLAVGAGASGVVANNNCIQNNGAGLVNASGTNVNATMNWWGAADGPSGAGPGSGDSIVNSGAGSTTTFSPFSTTPSCPGCALQRYVATTGSDSGNDCLDSGAPCLTIQHAVDVACDGNIINVDAGVYPEPVSIPKPVTIQGAGSGGTIVRPTAVTANTTHLVTAAPIAAIMLVDDAGPVFINDLTVDGSAAAFNACSPGYIGIYYRNSSGAIDTVAVTNVVHPSALGCQSVLGIFGQSGAGGATDLDVNNCQVDNYGKNGIVCNEAATTCDVTNNVVTGRGPVGSGDAAQNGIQFFAASGAIVSNTATANYYSPQSFCAAGILLISDNVLVQNNQLSANLCDLLAQTSGSDILGNDISPAGDFPLSVLGDGNTITQNFVSGSVLAAVYNDGINNTYTCNLIRDNNGGFQFDSSFAGFGTTAGTPNTVNDNSIYNNGLGLDATALDPMATPIDATGNWWGCAAGPGNPGCDTVAGNADASSPLAGPPVCVQCTSDADCTDGNPCTGDEFCNVVNGMCKPGMPPTCDDQNECTDDTCDPGTGCVNTPIDCNDDLLCTTDTCDPMRGCVYAPAVDCSVSPGPCFDVGECDPDTGECFYPQLSTGEGCVPDPPDPCCLSYSCNSNAECVAGCVDPICDDANACTTDTCGPAGCEHTPVDCEDGLFCTANSCDPDDGCGAITTCPPAINGCIFVNDSCDEDNDMCVDFPDDSQCDDDNICNGAETCNPANGQCVPGTPLTCSDGDSCNGVETCNPSSGCQPGLPPGCVPGDGCCPDGCLPQDDADCGFVAIPTVSTWGLIVLAILLAAMAKVYFGRRPEVA